MEIQSQINNYIHSLDVPKKTEMLELHKTICELMPKCKLWFLDGRNSENKIVSNPNIGYGHQILKYADGTAREFYQIGLSANKTGISIYLLSIKDKKYLVQNIAKDLGKASVTGYCIKFKTLKDINIEILIKALRFGFESKQ